MQEVESSACVELGAGRRDIKSSREEAESKTCVVELEAGKGAVVSNWLVGKHANKQKPRADIDSLN